MLLGWFLLEGKLVGQGGEFAHAQALAQQQRFRF